MTSAAVANMFWRPNQGGAVWKMCKQIWCPGEPTIPEEALYHNCTPGLLHGEYCNMECPRGMAKTSNVLCWWGAWTVGTSPAPSCRLLAQGSNSALRSRLLAELPLSTSLDATSFQPSCIKRF